MTLVKALAAEQASLSLKRMGDEVRWCEWALEKAKSELVLAKQRLAKAIEDAQEEKNGKRF
jgi:hypothetical protein